MTVLPTRMDLETFIMEMNSLSFIATSVSDDMYREVRAAADLGCTARQVVGQTECMQDAMSFAVYAMRDKVLQLKAAFYGDEVEA